MSEPTPRRGTPKRAPKGHCRWCLEPIDPEKHPRARSWHPACVAEWQAQQPEHQRAVLLARDNGVCAECGVDTRAIVRRLRGAAFWHGLRTVAGIPAPEYCYGDGWRRLNTMPLQREIIARGMSSIPWRLRSIAGGQKVPWRADHIVPLWAGGANHVDNMQTLCDPCHKAKTAREAGERAERKRLQQTGQQRLVEVAR